MKNTNYRHGDINFSVVTNPVRTGKKVNHNGSYVFALGETTGHKHVLTVEHPENLELYETEEGLMYWLKEEGYLSHEEHNTIILPPGVYIQKQEIEKDWFSLIERKVID